MVPSSPTHSVSLCNSNRNKNKQNEASVPERPGFFQAKTHDWKSEWGKKKSQTEQDETCINLVRSASVPLS